MKFSYFQIWHAHIEMKMQEGGKCSGRGLRELLQEGLQVELQLLLPPLHQALGILPKHLLRRKQPSVHVLLHHQLVRNMELT